MSETSKTGACRILSNLVEVDWDFPFKINILPPKERIALGTTIEGVLCSDWMIRWTKILSPCDVWVIIGSSRVGRIEPSQREQNPRYLGWSGGLLWQDYQGDQRGSTGCWRKQWWFNWFNWQRLIMKSDVLPPTWICMPIGSACWQRLCTLGGDQI